MKIILALILISITSLCSAQQEWSVGLGTGMDDTLIQSRSISHADQGELSWAYDLQQSFTSRYGYGEWWLQAGAIRLSGEHRGKTEQLSIVQLKPVLRFYPGGENGQFFYEAGLGAAKFSKDHFQQITVQTKGNFAIHFAMGWRWADDLKVSLRYSHFSNGYTHTPNPGLDTLSLNFHYWLD